MNSKFRNNVGAEKFAELVALRIDAQASWKVALETTGLSHSKAELAIMELEAENAGFEVQPLTGAFVAYCRNELRIGWGPIMVWTQSSEGSVRKAWEEKTNVFSACLRVGHGGRFKFNEPTLYVGELQPTGTTVRTADGLSRPNALEAAGEQSLTAKLTALDTKALRSVFTKFTGEQPAKKTRAQMIIAIKKANATKVAAAS